MMLCRSSLARAKIPLVIQIYTVRDRLKIVRQPKTFHHGEQLILAMKTARSIVADVFRAIKLGRSNDLQRDSLFAGESDGVRQMAAEFARIFKSLGFKFVTLDLEGFRSGSMNSLLTTDQITRGR